jgi:hypothetical protein
MTTFPSYQIVRDTTWAITTNGQNSISIPSGFNAINISYESGATGTLTINAEASVDSVYLGELLIQNRYSVLKQKMRSNLLIQIKNRSNRKFLSGDQKISPQEIKARETLRDMITESERAGANIKRIETPLYASDQIRKEENLLQTYQRLKKTA